ncbi:DUF805 domain-containing protein [Parapedobacter sp. SGR-10]|uniref:DUF805 domain-containing protein n=1 Tax=Parapedobacter sp. SGR-10 TaxID=2710879 RepID=UPI0013D56159|nr:DUF805 domain-containing protein [Parapedobacter sp. SGR-10]NGF55336.1 DUF805 domain-containing protein [Parapedobacter sp. SGR-10]
MEWFLKVVRDNYANFEGRARRKEYWMYTLYVMLIFIALSIVIGIISWISSTLGGILSFVIWIASLAILVPSLAVTVRRLHDTGKPTWYIVLNFIPIVNLYILYLLILEGDKGPNEFGPDPKATENQNVFAGQQQENNPFSNPTNPFTNDNN